ncbi:TIGR03084 family protein [Aliishimia ponticola]|uniref:TIGR03084 family protein n=1 Tax=Aliishimia ponticola TaxID=2499833 RepID=A0A4S4NFX0_9RHOB|nr:TIGR03084 family metal-binding protein [Aliishimia ponticola]THH37038.1 TIGR03084 family protein [Aliishimia ponticola]
MQQALDFVAESDALAAILEDVAEADWTTATQFKGWTLNDVIVHLHFWNLAADKSLTDPEGFAADLARLLPAMQSGMRPVENAEIPLRGPALFEAWRAQYRDMGDRWSQVDPKTRLRWAGPEMSARSSISARQMETWAHGQEVFDILGKTRHNADRIQNIVYLGVNAFGWSHKVHGLPVPDNMPYLKLTAPSGAVWEFGTPQEDERIEGAAEEFAQVVTQVRNIADTDLQVTGEVAAGWMARAQCFAGPPETPPAPGTRHTRAAPA